MTSIALHWAEIEALTKRVMPEVSDDELAADQALFNAGYMVALRDVGEAHEQAGSDTLKFHALLELLLFQCAQFCEARVLQAQRKD
jgi:hypothetical protein